MICDVEFSYEALPPLASLEREWRTLEAVARPSFFTSWQWIGTLLAAVPGPDPTIEAGRAFQPVRGEVPSPINPPTGCVFHPRCTMAVESCRRSRPELRELRPGHWVACSEVN